MSAPSGSRPPTATSYSNSAGSWLQSPRMVRSCRPETIGDLEIWVSFSAGVLSDLEIRSWQALDPENGVYGWLTLETLPRNPSQAAEQCNQDGTVCVVCNGVSVVAGDWPSFDSTGSSVGALIPDSFLEIGVNLTALFGQHTFENYYDSRFTSLRSLHRNGLRPGQLSAGHRSRYLAANSGS